MKSNTKLSESLEDYLEVILDLENTQKVARAKDIAKRLGVAQGSVTSALKNLGEKNLINYKPYSFITLTPGGKKIAVDITKRHIALKNFLLKILQIDEETAESTACRMEHSIDKNTMERLISFLDFINTCPRTGKDWLETFKKYCSSEKPDQKKCKECLENCITSSQKELN